jgi:hypothetical protein
MPRSCFQIPPSYFLVKCFLHFAQTKILLPEGNFSHCKFGICLLFVVGLNFPLNLILLQEIFAFFPQI